ncbi:hypothetical protein GLAREA_06041 [Glarea lozoyensis ATCC 20868]|uniref:Nucleic acid-binding protein n=1 Tax=Glarea lozoyensis (strain ATCC 20868 / MF5171) TaxID=1116229 RepID=S3D7B1_GLAL2|nr:uncharacterized protein GLAREA_06041 [Glarea lozoyensis ATCC 20868]EPE33029.1 hypothetical protein GLAREA_06041 [Glarea lozoyensis ATCC 20868]
MPPKTLLFVGAPESKALKWDEEELYDTFSEPFNRYIDGSEHTNNVLLPLTSTSFSGIAIPQWRSLTLERGHLTTGMSQDHGWQPEYRGASFFTVSDINSFVEEYTQKTSFGDHQSSVESVDQILSQFYEESYARHEEIASSQLRAASDTTNSSVSQADTTSFNSIESYNDSQPTHPKDIPKSGPLSSLQEFPNARYLNAIHPQVFTVNLVVGIISVPSPRSIRTRRGMNVELIETLVGDDTKSGFGINFWLSSKNDDNGLRASIESLRPQDVVLMRNVALSSFRDKVYGYSLRKGLTKVYLLHRSRVDRKDHGGCYSTSDLRRATGGMDNAQIMKAKIVREWVLRFVGGTNSRPSRHQQASSHHETLPPDTQ